jgi:crotonobetainyl-CoA:carnitine CoA-transferase CaiB-like acyl-CoA transferase
VIRDATLSGVRVLDLTEGYAGPYSTRLLADHGAEVIKVEPPSGDVSRQLGPFGSGADPLECSGTFLHLNRNKRGIVLDLDTADGRRIVGELAATADIVVESFRPGTLAALGLDPAELLARHPALVLCSITPFGQDGAYRDYDMTELVAYAMGGPMNATGTVDREPVKLVGNVVQMQAGNVACTAVLGALYGARTTGGGQHVDIAWFETQNGTTDRRRQYHLSYQYNGLVASRARTIGGGAAPGGTFVGSDGRAITTGPVWPDHVGRMLKTIGSARLSELYRDGRPSAADVIDEVNAELSTWAAGRTARQAMREAQDNGWPVVVVNTPRSLLTDDHLVARGFWVTLEHPVAGPVPVCGPSWRVGDDTTGDWDAAPTLGRHTDDVLSGLLGYASAEIERLHRAGVLGR